MSTASNKVEAIIAKGVRVLPKANGATAPDPLAWMGKFEMSTEQISQLADAKFIEPGLIPHSHIIDVPAPPNAGKTTIFFFYLAPRWTSQYVVVYVDADSNPADVKRMHLFAQRNGIRYLTPEYMRGLSMRDVVQELESLADSTADLSSHVWIFDTLKKLIDSMLSKQSLSKLLKLFRKLSAKGMTIILLSHTNKYRNADGELQFEGTQDVMSDVDEMIYFEPRTNPDESVTVSTRCVKRRAQIERFTWTIHRDRDRTVTQESEYVDVLAEVRQATQREKDETVIEAICEVLATGMKKQTEIIAHCATLKLTDKRVRAVLKRYSGDIWRCEKPFAKTEPLRFELLNSSVPLPNGKTSQTNCEK